MTEILHTARLTLRPLTFDDAPGIAALIGDLEVARWLTLVPHPYAVSDAEAFIESHQDQDGVWAITLHGQLIGIVTIRAELGYWLGKAFWGQGFMTEAARAVVADHFAQGRGALSSGYHLGNTGSAGVLSKLGFTATETRTAMSCALGHEVTIQGMALSRAAWEQAA